MDGRINGMKTTIDRAGRIIIPKSLRDRLGLQGGETIEVSERNGMIEIEVAATPMSLKETRDGPVVIVDKDMPLLTDEIVRETIEQIRR